MAKILKHGKYYNKKTGKLNLSINVLCPECMQEISVYLQALSKDNDLPCICYNCDCEFIPTEEDIVENEERVVAFIKGKV